MLEHVDQTLYLRDRGFHREQSMLSTLHKGRDFKASVAVDDIYGMLGMPALAPFSLYIEPDYTKDPQEVFRQVVEISVEHQGNLDALSYVLHPDGVSTTEPTWIPQWDEENIMNPMDLEPRPDWNAPRRSPVKLKVSGDVIESPGVCVDLIETWEDNDPEEWLFLHEDHIQGHPLLTFIRQNAKEGSKYLCTPAVLAYGRTQVAGADGDFLNDVNDDEQDRLNFLHYVVTMLKRAGESSDSYAAFDEEGGDWIHHASTADLMLSGRCVFTTTKGYIGSGRDLLEPGDKICVLYGGRVPYILRPQQKHYRIIGEAYLDGFMEGKALDLLDKGEPVEELCVIH